MSFVDRTDAIEIFVLIEIERGVDILHDVLKPVRICEELARLCMLGAVVHPNARTMPVPNFIHVMCVLERIGGPGIGDRTHARCVHLHLEICDGQRVSCLREANLEVPSKIHISMTLLITGRFLDDVQRSDRTIVQRILVGNTNLILWCD